MRMKNTLKKTMSGALAVTVILSALGLSQISVTEAAAAGSQDVVVFNGNEMQTFKNRSEKSVAQKYIEAKYKGKTYNNYNGKSYYSVQASVKAPYNEGKLSSDTLLAMQSMTDYYRWLVGAEPLKAKCVQSPSLQYQALDRNFEFNHYISQSSKPADMSQELWDKGFDCRHNILAWNYTPQDAITGWMNEGYNKYNNEWDTLGHRFALIDPDVSEVQFGYVGNIAIGVCSSYDNDPQKEIISAFPCPGYIPSNIINPMESCWNVIFDTDKVTADSEKTSVKVTDLSTKESYICTQNNYKLSASYGSVAFVQPDYEAYSNNYAHNYLVEITGLKTPTGKDAKIQYTVKFFDISKYEVNDIKLSKTALTLGKDETVRLSASVSPSQAINKTVSWRTSDSKILRVDSSGNVKAVGTGTAWITARSSNGIEKSCRITVKNAPEKITLTKGIVTIGVGEKFTVGSGVDNGAACSKRTYRTSNSSIVKMTRTDWVGDFVGVKPGVAYVTVKTYNGKESTCKVTVKAAPKWVKLNKTAVTLKVGQTASLSAIIPDGSGCAARTFSSSNGNIVKMTRTNWTGSFKAVQKGTANVTVRTYNGKTASCKVTVI